MKKEEIEKAVRYLSKDKNLNIIIKKSPNPDFKKGNNYFLALVRSIIYQQLSGKAAGTIAGRFYILFKNKKPNPKDLLKLKDLDFKKVGISGQKMGYLRDLALKFEKGEIDSKKIYKMEDEEVREHLIAVKGIGRWTADMFLMFTLVRPNVLPTGDLGIQKGFQKLFKMKKLPNEEKMLKLSENWKPYRTVASWYLWRVVDDKDTDW